MNNIRLVKTYPIDADLLKYRLSTLPAWIRFFECILHIAYRLPIDKWQVRNEDKDKVETKIRNPIAAKKSDDIIGRHFYGGQWKYQRWK